jgi:glucuronate isomerase
VTRFHAVDYVESDLRRIFDKVRSGRSADTGERAVFESAMWIEFARMDHAKGWTQQYHFGALRNARTRMRESRGNDAGCDSIGDAPVAEPLARLLDCLDQSNHLPPTILYNCNPHDNAVAASLIGSFQDGVTPGKMQWGPAWWHLDPQYGIEAQLNTLSAMGLLSRFIGMTSDSRSLLSLSRHEYFRRVLCNLLGADMETGRLPRNLEAIGGLVQDICFYNAQRYFGF